MKQTFYFYDLETSSGSPRTGRIMQFAGQRTTLDLQLVGEADDILVKLADDVLPDPEAILVHKITPQKTLIDGISEAEFVKYFESTIATPGTIFVGYNNVRFDDEFMRFSLYRSLRDPYTWHWQDGRSRWDMLDAVRMMRALRPEGIDWPFASDGKPTVRLESMSKINSIEHSNAHDALADIRALIALAKMYKSTQPKLFNYLVDMRAKRKVATLAESNAPFVYTSGKFENDHLKTTVVCRLFDHPDRSDVIVVYDLRYDPEQLEPLTAEEIAQHWQDYKSETHIPLKTMQYNRCPAVAPLGVLDKSAQERIHLPLDIIQKNYKKLQQKKQLNTKVLEALKILNTNQQALFQVSADVDSALYDDFWNEKQKNILEQLVDLSPSSLQEQLVTIDDTKISELAFRYVARNYHKLLQSEFYERWQSTRFKLLNEGDQKSKFANFSKRFQEVSARSDLTEEQRYLLTELQLYVESILPVA